MSDEKPVTKIDDSLAQQTASVNAPNGGTQDFRPDTLTPGTPALPSSVKVPGYRILNVLGRGGMGVVYKAIQEKANRPVALKMILAGAHADAQDQMRFRVEAEAAARLSHPNIVQLYEVGETPDGFPYFSLEFVAGGTLSERLKQSPLRSHEAASLVESLARAMQYAHERGIVHRDLKPLNILLDGGRGQESGVKSQGSGDSGQKETMIKDQGAATINRPSLLKSRSDSSQAANAGHLTPKISDFGLAKQLDAEDGLTRTGAIMGSPAYMAPEQAFGQSKNVGPAADIYALGAILYECLTGRPPFKGATVADTLEQVRTMEPITLKAFAKEIPADLETICLHCLRKEPQRRYASADALADDLRRYVEGKPISVRPVGNLERAWRWCRRNPGWAAMIAVVAVSLLGATGSSSYAYLEVSAKNEVLAGEIQERKKQTEIAEKKTELAKERTLLAEARGEQANKAVGLFATDARMYCDDAMVPGDSRRRLYEVLIKQLEAQANQASGEATIDALRNKTFMYQTLCSVNLSPDFQNVKTSLKWNDKGMASVDDWEKLSPADPTALGFRSALLNLRATAMKFQRKYDVARDVDTQALKIRERLVGDPDVDLLNKVDAVAKLADSQESLDEYEKSIALRTKVRDLFEQDSKDKKLSPLEATERSFPYRDALCETYTKAGLHATDYAKRKEYLSQANFMSIALHRDRAANRKVLLRWSMIAKMLGELEYNHGKLAEKEGKKEAAEAHFDLAAHHFAKLKEHSYVLATSDELVDGLREYARSFYTLGLAEQRNGFPEKARAAFQKSWDIRNRTLKDYGDRNMSIHLQLDLYFSQLALGKLDETMDAILHLLIVSYNEPDAAYRLACIHALAINTMAEIRGAKPFTVRDKSNQDRWRDEAFRGLYYAYDGGFTDFFQGSIDADLDAIRDDPRMKEFEAGHHYKLGVLALNHGDAKKARAEFKKSQELATEFMEKLPKDSRANDVKIAWLCAQVRLGQPAEAVAAADELRPKLGSLRRIHRFKLARVYALASMAVDDETVKVEYRTKALAALDDGAESERLPMLLADDELEPIRVDPRFAETRRRFEKLRK